MCRSNRTVEVASWLNWHPADSNQGLKGASLEGMAHSESLRNVHSSAKTQLLQCGLPSFYHCPASRPQHINAVALCGRGTGRKEAGNGLDDRQKRARPASAADMLQVTCMVLAGCQCDTT